MDMSEAERLIKDVYRATRIRNSECKYRGLPITVYVGDKEYRLLYEMCKYNTSGIEPRDTILSWPIIRVRKDSYFAVHIGDVTSAVTPLTVDWSAKNLISELDNPLSPERFKQEYLGSWEPKDDSKE